MSIKEGILVELDRETKNTKRIIERVRDENLSWKPHEKSMTLGELLGHVVELHGWVNKTLDKDGLNLVTDYVPFKPTKVLEFQERLEADYKSNVDTVKNLADEDWFKTWTMSAGEHVIAQMPKLGAFRYIIQNHLIHHRGQLTVYLRMLDIPVPGLYGPSADDHKN